MSKAVLPPPETRRWATYAEAAAFLTQHFYPIAARTLTRVPLPTKRVGRSLLVDMEAVRAHGEAAIAGAPTITRATERTPNKPRLKIAG